ncbi:MAG TPA: Imm48 family immunity protein [Verrucomicrobiae bacterium]|nr:Imm48 family immunity protein [Verrucomicrobiae bacterium]
MGFLNSLFGKKQDFPPPDSEAINNAVATLEEFCRDIMKHVGEASFAAETMEKQTLSLYAFGGLHVLCQQRGMPAPHGHAVCITFFHTFFGWPSDDSAAKAQACISAASDRTSHLHNIIHRGIDGFLSWQEHRDTFDASDFRDVITTMRRKKASA